MEYYANTAHRKDTFGFCLSEFTSYILNDFIEEAAKYDPSGEKARELIG